MRGEGVRRIAYACMLFKKSSLALAGGRHEEFRRSASLSKTKELFLIKKAAPAEHSGGNRKFKIQLKQRMGNINEVLPHFIDSNTPTPHPRSMVMTVSNLLSILRSSAVTAARISSSVSGTSKGTAMSKIRFECVRPAT